MSFAALLVAAVLVTAPQNAAPPAPQDEALSKPSIIAGNSAPEPTFMSCTAQSQCSDSRFTSGPVACAGNTTCVSAPEQVVCDGNYVLCSCDGMPSNCGNNWDYCWCRTIMGQSAVSCIRGYC